MSLCVSFYDDNKLLVCADSRVSSEVEGNNYLVTDEYKKIRQVGDKVIFISGEVEIAEDIFNSINEYSTIQMIKKRTKKCYEEFAKLHKNVPGYQNTEYGIEIGVYIFTFEDGVPVIYQMGFSKIHNNGEFIFERQIPNHKQLSAVAAKSDEALPYAQKLTKRMPLERAILKTYEHFACEIIGGNLHSYLIDSTGIRFKTEKIKENRKYPKWQGRAFNFHADMRGNTYLNKLTANTAVINDSQFNGGNIIGSSVNVNNRFLVDSNGNMSATNARFSGDITGSTITGSLFKTATSSRRIELDQRGFRAIDSSGATRISIQTDSDQGIAGIGFNDASGSWQGQIIATSSDLSITAKNGLVFSGGVGGINHDSRVYFTYSATFNSPVTFNSSVYGITINDVSGLYSKLDSLQSQIDTLRSEKANKNTYTSSSSSYNGGIAPGTVLVTASGGRVTWQGIPSHDHRQN
ncbi:hypothetical protein QJQ58_15645 [Paenibacillus dendritiformis]|uniref:hypothetical protein n=1 Tax=Paenibacillus dendritiformis TaxID=130049 RepID=UPI00248AAC39|nr:hypothetical protein [Paenibacillus dendritiformis]WGU92045.1 hypothetical protein QJQ58_15645 [Paenibacillus dendritiformis]